MEPLSQNNWYLTPVAHVLKSVLQQPKPTTPICSRLGAQCSSVSCGTGSNCSSQLPFDNVIRDLGSKRPPVFRISQAQSAASKPGWCTGCICVPSRGCGWQRKQQCSWEKWEMERTGGRGDRAEGHGLGRLWGQRVHPAKPTCCSSH